MIFNYPIDKDIKISDYLNSFHLGKPKIYKLFLEKKLMVNGILCNNNTLLHKGDVLELSLEEEIDFIPLDKKIDVLYEDDYLLIINKPSGTIIYDDKANPVGLANMVASYYKKNGISLNVRFPHRLDTDTTGIIVFCKDILTHSYFNYYMANHEIKREYRALVEGSLKKKKDTLRIAISKDRHVNGKMFAGYGNDIGITHYEVLEDLKKVSLVRVLLETGKTHQIRCHFSYLGHPLLGDRMYGSSINAKRIMLHSYKLTFIHPVTNKEMVITCRIPGDMEELYDFWKVRK